jgi:hypothetical protein
MFENFLKRKVSVVFSEITHGPRWEVLFVVALLLLEYLLITIWPPAKESRNRPGVAQRVPGGLGSQIS